MQRVSSDSGIHAVGEVPFGTHFCHHHLVKPVDPSTLQALIASLSRIADTGDRAEPAH